MKNMISWKNNNNNNTQHLRMQSAVRQEQKKIYDVYDVETYDKKNRKW